MTEDVAAKGDFVVGRRVAGVVAKEDFVVRRGVAVVVTPKAQLVERSPRLQNVISSNPT